MPQSRVTGRVTEKAKGMGPFRAKGSWLLAMLGCLLFSSIQAEPLKLTAGQWPPYVDEKLPGQGLAMDLATSIFREAGYQPSFVLESWARARAGVNAQVYDVLVSTWHTDERAAQQLFSRPFYTNQIRFIKQRDVDISFSSLGDLDNLLIGTVTDYAYDEAFLAYGEAVQVTSNHVIQNLLLLDQGKLDLTLGDDRVLRHEIDTYIPSARDRLEILPNVLSERELYVTVSRDHPRAQQIIDDFNQALAVMRDNGEYDRILARHP